MVTAFCTGCGLDRIFDRHWRALHVDSDGDYRDTAPERDGDLTYERPGTVLVCGQGCALVVYERYLDTGSVVSAHHFKPSALEIFTDRLFDPTYI